MACRDSKKAEQAAKDIIKLTNNINVNAEYLDLADLDTVRNFAEKMKHSIQFINSMYWAKIFISLRKTF